MVEGYRTIEGAGAWSNQPALSHAGNAIYFAWNHADSAGVMRVFVQPRLNGRWVAPLLVDDLPAFKGYTTSLEEVAPGEALQIFWSQQISINVDPAFVMGASVPLP